MEIFKRNLIAQCPNFRILYCSSSIKYVSKRILKMDNLYYLSLLIFLSHSFIYLFINLSRLCVYMCVKKMFDQLIINI